MKGMMPRHMPMMISCREFENFILAYLEGELPARQRRTFELHIRICRECRDYLAAYRLSTELARRAFEDPDQPLPEDVPDDLVKAILAAKNT
jgi:anti-sigma factor RsiW